MEIKDWPDSKVYEWLHANDAVLTLCYGKARHKDGHVARVIIQDPYKEGRQIIGCSDQVRGCISAIGEGMLTSKENKKD